jgi:hypothetical protein
MASELNAILWKDSKGKTPMPVPKHSVFSQKGEQGD